MNGASVVSWMYTRQTGNVPRGAYWALIAAVAAYLCGTVLLFVYGPWRWPTSNHGRVVVYAMSGVFALTGGFVIAHRIRPVNTSRFKVETVVRVSAAATLALALPTVFARTGELLPNLYEALMAPGEAYDSYQAARGLAPIEYLRMAAAPLLFLSAPLVIFYWPQLGRQTRILGVAAMASIAYIAIGTGTNQQLANLLVLAPWLIVARSHNRSSRFWKRMAVAGGLILTVLGFAAFFNSGQATRVGSSARSGYNFYTGIVVDNEHWLMTESPPAFRPAVTASTSYLTHGYFALALSLDEGFEPSYGLGNSLFTLRNSHVLPFIPEIRDRPYPVRIEPYAWPHDRAWATIYPWLASDFTFPGALIAVGFAGWALGASWKESLAGSGPLAVGAFSQFLILAAYIPANNQVVQSGENFFAFYFLTFLWLFARWRARRRMRRSLTHANA